jgi:hypothetical protein
MSGMDLCEIRHKEVSGNVQGVTIEVRFRLRTPRISRNVFEF